MRSVIKELLKGGDWEPNHSYDNFHAPGVSYVCLLRSQALTAKLYHFDPSSLKPVGDAWGRPIVVNPHSHRYNFQTTVLAGELHNVTYKEEEFDPYRRLPSPPDNYRQIKFTGALDGAPPATKDLGGTRLLPLNEVRLGVGDSYDCAIHEVHSVIPHQWKPTLIALLQYKDVRSASDLFVRGETPSFEGLYQKLEKDKALSILRLAKDSL